MAYTKHQHIDPNAGDAKIIWAIAVNMLLTIVQVVGGVLSGSLALIGDALHNLSDALALVIALLARKVARWPGDENMSFGYARAEVIAALINYTSLIMIGLYLVYQALWRFFEPTSIDGWLMIIIASVALAVDLITALLTYRLSKQSMNMRAAFVHNLTDAVASIGVILVGVLILLYDWTFIDPLVTLAIAAYILYLSIMEIKPVIRILMLASPSDIDSKKVAERIRDIQGVIDVEHLHFWQMSETKNSLEAHVLIAKSLMPQAECIKKQIKMILKRDFLVTHITIEFTTEKLN